MRCSLGLAKLCVLAKSKNRIVRNFCVTKVTGLPQFIFFCFFGISTFLHKNRIDKHLRKMYVLL